MKKTNNTRRLVLGGLLAGIYLIFWIVLALHHSFSPAHHHEQSVCHHAANEEHLHTEEYAEEGCDLCQFLLIPSELTTFDLPFFPSALLRKEKPVATNMSYCGNKTVFALPRAPPTSAI